MSTVDLVLGVATAVLCAVAMAGVVIAVRLDRQSERLHREIRESLARIGARS